MVIRIRADRSEPLIGSYFDDKAGERITCNSGFESASFDLTFELTADSFEWVEDLSGAEACG